jgi:RNA polymerase sigma factor (sigma-70 family)
MRFYSQPHAYYCGIDLHTRTLSLCLLDTWAGKMTATAAPKPKADAGEPAVEIESISPGLTRERVSSCSFPPALPMRCRYPAASPELPGWRYPAWSSNWRIKTARCEDNEGEATMAARLKSMTTSPLSVVLRHLLADLRPEGNRMTDGELLVRYLGSRDEDALAALVRRHAPMVWGVCRRLLHSHHDAEDAFQAAYLVLVRKAARVPKDAVANWLYGVARQTAVRLRATAAKQGRRETQVVTMPEPTVAEGRDADLRAVLDEELSRLPDHYRNVVVLCDLEGATRKEAARQLAIPEGSVASRLARARVMLAKRLTQRGVVFSGGALVVLSAGSASAPPALVASTIRAASLLAAGRAAGVVSAKVAALTEGTVKAMFVSNIKSVLAVVVVVGLTLSGVGAGVGLFTNPVAVAQQSGAKPDDLKNRAAQESKDVAKEIEKLEARIAELKMKTVKAKVVAAAKDRIESLLKEVDAAGGDRLETLEEIEAVLKRMKEDAKKMNDTGKKLLPGEIKRELNRGVVLRVRLVELDAKALLMTAEVEPARGKAPKPLRLANLIIAGNATVTDGEKELKLDDLKAGSVLRLQLESWKLDGEEMAVSGIRVEDDGTERKPIRTKPQEKNKAYTIEEALTELPKEEITIEFKVGKAGAVWVTGATLGQTDADGDKQITLFPAGTVSDKFYVVIDKSSLKALGVSKADEFVGKTVRVRGQVEATSRPVRPNTTGRIIVWELNQIELGK